MGWKWEEGKQQVIHIQFAKAGDGYKVTVHGPEGKQEETVDAETAQTVWADITTIVEGYMK